MLRRVVVAALILASACGREEVANVGQRSLCPDSINPLVTLVVRPPEISALREGVIEVAARAPEPVAGADVLYLQSQGAGGEWIDRYRLAGDVQNPPSKTYSAVGSDGGGYPTVLVSTSGPLNFRVPPLPKGKYRLCVATRPDPTYPANQAAALADLIVR